MTRVGFVRSVPVERARPYLGPGVAAALAVGDEAVLVYTDGECQPDDFPGRTRKLPEAAEASAITAALLEEGVDCAVSISLPDENTMRDALVQAQLDQAGIPMVMHDPHTTRALVNKWDTKKLLQGVGVRVPEGVLVNADLVNGRGQVISSYVEHIEHWACQAGFPLIAKPLWGSLGMGVTFLPDAASLRTLLGAELPTDVVIERCLTGELCSVEILGGPGAYWTQPLCWNGPAGGAPGFGFWEVRHCRPWAPREDAFGEVADGLHRVLAHLGARGVVNVDLVYSEGDFYVLEVNPRISGITSMSIASSGVNTFAALTQMALGRWTPPKSWRAEAARWSLEFPIDKPTDAFVRAAADAVDLVRAADLFIDGVDYGGNMIVSAERGAEAELCSALARLQAGHGHLSAATLDRITAVVLDRQAVA